MKENNSVAGTVDNMVTNFVMCCKLELTDKTVMAFTNCTEDLSIDKRLYKSSTFISATGAESTNNLSVDNLDISGILNSEEIKEQDLLKGRFDSADIEVFMTNVKNTSEKNIIMKGTIGEIKIDSGRFVAEVRSLTQKLQCKIGELYSSNCRASFGDGRCKVKLSEYTYYGKVETVDKKQNRQIFTAKLVKGKLKFNLFSGGLLYKRLNEKKPFIDTVIDFKDPKIIKTSGYFDLGLIAWTSGSNNKLKMAIKSQHEDQFILSLPMGESIKVDDEFKVVAGCDKTFFTCCNRFKNSINFRGEPHVPGNDKILETPSTRNK